MRRAARLFQIVDLVRGRRLSTARFLAERLEVSLRTVYRDVADLQAQGVPIEGEAGVGYRMRRGFDLPPLMFTTDEARALVAAVRMAAPRLDTALTRHGALALAKILAVLPANGRAAAEALPVYAPDMADGTGTRDHLEQARRAIESHHKLQIDYLDLQGVRSARVLQPLGCFYWGAVWTLAGWCESRQDFRSFRVDRIEHLVTLEERCEDTPGRRLPDLLRAVGARWPESRLPDVMKAPGGG